MIRQRYIDIVKGLSILCIVLLHYAVGAFPNEINVFVGSFMITAFYVTSGWIDGMNPKMLPLKTFIRKRLGQLGIPYLYWSCIIVVFDIILWSFDYYNAKYIAKDLYKTVTFRGIGTLWFLPALLGGSILWHWLKQKTRTALLLLLFFTIVYQELYNYYFVGKDAEIVRIIDAPFRTIYNILQAWVGIAFGYYAYKLTKITNPVYLFIAGIVCLGSAYIVANYYPFSMGWSYFAPLWGPLGLIYLFKSVEKYALFAYLNYWGQNSLNLMLTHYSITLVIVRILFDNILHTPFVGRITLIAFICSLPVQHLFVYLVNRFAIQTLGKIKKNDQFS